VGGPRIAIRIGPIAIAWYGILIVGSALVAAYVAERQALRKGEDPEHIWNALMLCLLLGMIGARLYHVVSSLDYYLQNPLDILNLRHGGLAIYGAVAGGALGLWIYVRRNGMPFDRWADFAAPGLVLAQAIARWGNYLNQELYGFPTSLPWGITIDEFHRIPPYTDLQQYPLSTRFHPTFLYESIACFFCFVILLTVSRLFEERLKDGDVILLYGVLYPLVRLFTETQRPDAWRIAGVATAQWISLAAIVLCGGLLLRRHRNGSTVLAEKESSTE